LTKNDSKDLFKMMRAAGVRKKVAAEICDAVAKNRNGDRKPPKRVRQAAEDFSALAALLEDHAGRGRGASTSPAKSRTGSRTRSPGRRPRTAQGSAAAPAGREKPASS
jgi:hypothetical protein